MRVLLPVTGKVNDGMSNDEWICSKTDTEGIITYVNDVFCRVAGYSVDELIGQPQNIVRHPDMPCVAFAWCWDELQRGKEWRGYVKNRCKNGDSYWVDATITPQRDSGGSVTGFFAVRRKVAPEKVAEMEAFYRNLAEAEGSVEQRAKLSRGEISELYKRSPLYALAHPEAGQSKE